MRTANPFPDAPFIRTLAAAAIHRVLVAHEQNTVNALHTTMVRDRGKSVYNPWVMFTPAR
jgi:hypothetical protein